jgi:hypothetical protein
MLKNRPRWAALAKACWPPRLSLLPGPYSLAAQPLCLPKDLPRGACCTVTGQRVGDDPYITPSLPPCTAYGEPSEFAQRVLNSAGSGSPPLSPPPPPGGWPRREGRPTRQIRDGYSGRTWRVTPPWSVGDARWAVPTTLRDDRSHA